jgi:hypothetical protein
MNILKGRRKHHLCYSFNIFNEADAYPLSPFFKKHIKLLRQKILPDIQKPFAVGLWLNAHNLQKILKPDAVSALKTFLKKEHLYVFTINAFPYGSFHGKRIKENVYIPDWRSVDRLEYTTAIAEFLAEILPEGISGSISSVPGGYKKNVSKSDFAKFAKNIIAMNAKLRKIYREKGRKIYLALEFEPDCLWENAGEFVEFKEKFLPSLDYDENMIGVCYDSSHAEIAEAVPQEDFAKLAKKNIPIPKIQISAALESRLPNASSVLAKFAKSNYLHQSLLIRSNGEKTRFPDLSELLKKRNAVGTVISHYHLPIFLNTITDGLKARKNIIEDLIKIFSENCQKKEFFFEIETYTYHNMPEIIKREPVCQRIAREYRWFQEKLAAMR